MTNVKATYCFNCYSPLSAAQRTWSEVLPLGQALIESSAKADREISSLLRETIDRIGGKAQEWRGENTVQLQNEETNFFLNASRDFSIPRAKQLCFSAFDRLNYFSPNQDALDDPNHLIDIGLFRRFWDHLASRLSPSQRHVLDGALGALADHRCRSRSFGEPFVRQPLSRPVSKTIDYGSSFLLMR